jgi:phosphoglycerol transferase
VGSFNAVIAHLIRYKIRSYGRVSIFIAFFSLFAVLILLQNLYEKYIVEGKPGGFLSGGMKIPVPRLLFYAAIAMMTVAGIYDQTGRRAAPEYDAVRSSFMHDGRLVRSIERSVPAGSMIFQLPYVPYPESPSPHKMKPYDHLRYYLHTTRLRWSSGAMKGRPTDAWQRSTAGKPAAAMIREIEKAGFAGIMIDRDGYADGGDRIAGEVRRILGVEPMRSEDGTVLFFRIAGPRG